MIHSPNTVLAKYLKDVIDIVQPRLELNNPKEICLYVGTNINGAPHIGTYLVQSFAFVIAHRIRDKFHLPVKIIFGIHDNISFDSKEDSDGNVFHRTYHHALGGDKIRKLADEYYSSYFKELERVTGIAYNIEIYSEKQATRDFREHFLKTLDYADSIRWCTAPSSGFLQIRIPCPKCLYSERDAAHTKLIKFDDQSATFQNHCIEHGLYESEITLDNKTYIDLNTLYRNIVKEFSMTKSDDVLHIAVKGGDWVYSTETVDWALGILGYTSTQAPMRMFLPQVVANTGAKFSKSFIGEGHKSMEGIPEWMIDMRKFKERDPNYLDKLLRLTEIMMLDPRHIFRSYSYQEIERILSEK